MPIKVRPVAHQTPPSRRPIFGTVSSGAAQKPLHARLTAPGEPLGPLAGRTHGGGAYDVGFAGSTARALGSR